MKEKLLTCTNVLYVTLMKKIEGTSLGLFYTATTRATTLGDDDGLNSAIYFSGTRFREERIRGLTKLKT